MLCVEYTITWSYCEIRATEQLVGLPDDETPDDLRYAAEPDPGTPQKQEGGANLWLQGRVAFAKSLMDVGEDASCER